MSDGVKRPETPLRRSRGDTFWLVASALSAVVLIGGAGYWFWSSRGGISGPAVGEKVEMPAGLGRATQQAGESLRGIFGGGGGGARRGDATTRPGNAARRPQGAAATRPATRPARN